MAKITITIVTSDVIAAITVAELIENLQENLECSVAQQDPSFSIKVEYQNELKD